MPAFLPPDIEAAILSAHDLANEEAEGWRCVGLTPTGGSWRIGLIEDSSFLSKLSAHQRLEAAAGLEDVGEWFRSELEPLLPAKLAEEGGLRFLLCRKTRSWRMDETLLDFPGLSNFLSKAAGLRPGAPAATGAPTRPDVWIAPQKRAAAWICLYEPPQAERSCSMHEEHAPSAEEAELLAAFLRRTNRKSNGGTKIEGHAFGSWVSIRKAADESDGDVRKRAFLSAALLSLARRAKLGNPGDLPDKEQKRLLTEIAEEALHRQISSESAPDGPS